jgi:hypothetical protein
MSDNNNDDDDDEEEEEEEEEEEGLEQRQCLKLCLKITMSTKI